MIAGSAHLVPNQKGVDETLIYLCRLIYGREQRTVTTGRSHGQEQRAGTTDRNFLSGAFPAVDRYKKPCAMGRKVLAPFSQSFFSFTIVTQTYQMPRYSPHSHPVSSSRQSIPVVPSDWILA